VNYIEQKAEEAKAKKRADWEAIKRNAPALAEFMVGLKAAFGEIRLKELKFAKGSIGKLD
jgi:uncharacterized membrane protein